MGWKTYTTIISNHHVQDEEAFLNELGYTYARPIPKETFEVAQYPDDSEFYIGYYKGHTIICCAPLANEIVSKGLSKQEKAIFKWAPNSEICSLILHSVVNLWGFSVAKNNKKIRAKAGSADSGTFLDYGTPLPEEDELLSRSYTNDEGLLMFLSEVPEIEEGTEDQIGENYIFELCKRYFGKRLDFADDELFALQLSGYRIKEGSKKGKVVEEDEKSHLNYILAATFIAILIYIIYKSLSA